MEVLADRAGLDRTYVGRLERGERQPTIVAAVALAEAMGLSLSDLLLRSEKIAGGDDATCGGAEVELVPAVPARVVDRACTESDAHLRSITGMSSDTIVAAIDETYHTLDLLDRQLEESGAPRFAKLVELANLSSMIGNIVGGAIARHSNGLYERSGPHKYQDLRATDEYGEHVEIKTALETNPPKGHLPKAGYYLTLRYVLAHANGEYVRGKDNRGEVVWIWEVRFGFLHESSFSESNTAGDSGKTAVVKNESLNTMERVFFCPDYFPYANLNNRWGVPTSGGGLF